MVVPGSGLVKRQAEAEGLDRVFLSAGFEWREPGCSMCLAMNPDKVPAGERCASTSNRNFVGRQGPGARTPVVAGNGGCGGGDRAPRRCSRSYGSKAVKKVLVLLVAGAMMSGVAAYDAGARALAHPAKTQR